MTINKDATACLDSSNAFEGPEKLLEVWFSPSAASLPATAQPNGLKAISGETWKEMLDIVNCQVLSTVESEQVDAYLLSESSMFVFPHKLVLKTCGTTTLLLGLPRMLEIAGTAGFPPSPDRKSTSAYPHRVFYSRKNFLFPDKQVGPHRSWRDEVYYLDRQFGGGSAYMIGKMNGEHWYLYITSPSVMMTPPLTPDEEKTLVFEHAGENGMATEQMKQLQIDAMDDETLEILMTDLDEDTARQFHQEEALRILHADPHRQAYTARFNGVDRMEPIPEQARCAQKNAADEADDTFDVFAKQSLELSNDTTTAPSGNEDFSEGHLLGTAISDHCGLSDVYPTSEYPDARIDAYVFSPCGFSANAVVPSPKKPELTHYFNVHVTPEPGFSYASFETNVPAHQSGRETADVVAQVVNIFKPGRFSVTLFEAKTEDGSVTKLKKGHRMDNIPGYKRVDRVLHDLEGYELVFRHFARAGFQGGSTRIGDQ